MAVFVGATVIIYIVLTCVSVQNMHVDQRAWISAKQPHIVAFSEGNPFQLTVPFLNTGKTPALNVEEAISWEVPDKSKTMSKPTKEMISALAFVFYGALGPQDRAQMQVVNNDVTKFYSAVQSRQAFLYFYGEVRYGDIFGGKHSTTFCVLYVPANIIASHEAEMTPCESGNDMN